MMTSRYYWLGLLTLIGLFALSSALAGPLHDAAWRGNLTVVTGLIALGTDVSAKKEDAKTPLHLAAMQGHTAAAPGSDLRHATAI